MLGSNHHEGNTENRIGTGRKDLQLLVMTHQVEEDLCTYRATDPVALNLLQRVTPLEALQAVQHALGIGCHAQQPLLHALLLYGVTATHRKAILHLVVGQYRAQLRTPVYHRVGAEGETVVLQHLLLLGLRLRVPLFSREIHLQGRGGIYALRA